MRNGRRILLAILKLYVQIKIRVETMDANHPFTDSMRTIIRSFNPETFQFRHQVRSADLAVSGETIRKSIGWGLVVDILHVMHIKDNQRRYGLVGPGIESQWGRDFPYPSRRALGFHPTAYIMGTGSNSRG
jgi:hypothetical protein